MINDYIDVIRSQNLYSIGNRTSVLCVLTAEFLMTRFVVPLYDRDTNTGYQRAPSRFRISQLKNEIYNRKVDLPTAILLSMRSDDYENSMMDYTGVTRLSARLNIGEKKLYVVDGQHRLEAIKELYNENKEKWGGFIIPCVIILGATEKEELKEFYVVNSTARSVKTDLALVLLKKRADQENIMTELIEKNMDWKVLAQEIVEELSKTNVWSGLIGFPGKNQKIYRKTEERKPIISSSGFVQSLKSALSYPFFSTIDTRRKLEIIKLYWGAVISSNNRLLQTPGLYSVQKSVGVSALNEILPVIIEIVRSKGESVYDQDSYNVIMSNVVNMIDGENQYGATVSGEDFWVSGPEGAIGAYSSSSGKRVLIAKMKEIIKNI